MCQENNGNRLRPEDERSNMEIINIDLTRLRGEECFGFMQRVHALSVASLTGEAELAALAPLGTAVEALSEALQQSKKNPHTEAMTEADRAAETAFCAARAYLFAMQGYPDKAVATVARNAWLDTFAKYDYLPVMGATEKYGNYHALLSDLQELSAADVATLGLAPWLDAMNVAYAGYCVARDNRVSWDANYRVGLTTRARTDIESAYRTFVDKLNALLIINGSSAYASFVAQLNVIITDMRAVVRGRSSKARNKVESGKMKDESEKMTAELMSEANKDESGKWRTLPRPLPREEAAR